MARALVAIVATLAAFLAAAGCLGGAAPAGSGAPEPSSTQGTVIASQAPIPTEAGQPDSRGAIQGEVLNPWNESVADATVILLGTPSSMKTDALGRFGFAGLTPGDYQLRVDAANLESVEAPVRVDAGNVTRLEVRLVFREDLQAGFRPHVHDLWLGLERKTIFSGPLQWKHAVVEGEVDQQTCVGTGTGSTGRPPQGAAPCSYVEVPLKDPIPPGAREMEIRISWKQQDFVKQVNLNYRTANATPIAKSLVLPNGAMKNFSLERADTDNGHAPYTTWWMIFYVEFKLAGDVSWNQGDLIRQQVGDFQVELVAIRGELWTEEPHRHFWTEGPRMVVMDNVTQTLVEPQYKRDPQNRAWSSSGNAYFAPADKSANLVPPGTTRLQVTLTYTLPLEPLGPYVSHKTLAFRVGNVDRWRATMDQLRVEAPKSDEAGRTTYELVLKPEETDSVYAKKSNWLFLMANKGQERATDLNNEGGAKAAGTVYKILVVAFNDNYAADFAAGRL